MYSLPKKKCQQVSIRVVGSPSWQEIQDPVTECCCILVIPFYLSLCGKYIRNTDFSLSVFFSDCSNIRIL